MTNLQQYIIDAINFSPIQHLDDCYTIAVDFEQGRMEINFDENALWFTFSDAFDVNARQKVLIEISEINLRPHLDNAISYINSKSN